MKKTLSILIAMLAFVLISCSPNIKSPENEIPNQETTESEDTDQGQVNSDYLIVLTNLDDDTSVNSRGISKPYMLFQSAVVLRIEVIILSSFQPLYC